METGNVGDPICYKRMVRTRRERYHPIWARRQDRYMIEGNVDARPRETQVRVGVEGGAGVERKYGGCF
jgi:hypothetical protein